MNNQNNPGVSKSIESIRKLLSSASNSSLGNYYNIPVNDVDYYIEVTEYYVERAYSKTLVLLDLLGLDATYKYTYSLYKKAEKDGFGKEKKGPHDEEPYLVWISPLEAIVDSISEYYSLAEGETKVSRDLLAIIQESIYSITNKDVFQNAPQCEDDVHKRIEAILKCTFPDLLHKPRLAKPIKNFEPDTGLPSLKTLVEYKYISNKTEAKRIADEILADSRGYISNEWNIFIYVIYETHRVKPEKEWNQLIASCKISGNSKVIVLHGEPKA